MSALAATLALGGCGGIEFQGKVFDYVGLSGDRQEPDVKMADRPPLLLPPNTKALPQPGSGVAVATAREDWPKNPEIVQQEAVEAQKAAKAEEVTDATDPINPLQGKSNPLLDKWLSKKKEVVQPDDTPEPDPTDKPSESETVAQSKPKPLTPHVSQELPPPTAQDPFHPAPPESYKNPDVLY
ncbi:MAG: hypothetical protein WBW51_13505 [Methyloceanibacter sp.]